MKEIKRTTGDKEFPVYLRLGDNTYYYNYDRKYDGKTLGEIPLDQYSCIQVHIAGYPNSNDCIKEVIRTFVTSNEEFELINNYNANVDKQAYLDYLALLKTIKEYINADFNE